MPCHRNSMSIWSPIWTAPACAAIPRGRCSGRSAAAPVRPLKSTTHALLDFAGSRSNRSPIVRSQAGAELRTAAGPAASLADEAVRAGRTITRIALSFEAGRDGFWLARWLEARGVEAHVIHPSSVFRRRPPSWRARRGHDCRRVVPVGEAGLSSPRISGPRSPRDLLQRQLGRGLIAYDLSRP